MLEFKFEVQRAESRHADFFAPSGTHGIQNGPAQTSEIGTGTRSRDRHFGRQLRIQGDTRLVLVGRSRHRSQTEPNVRCCLIRARRRSLPVSCNAPFLGASYLCLTLEEPCQRQLSR